MAADDIADAEIERIVELAQTGRTEQLDKLLKELSARNSLVLIERLRSRAGRQTRKVTEQLLRRLARNGTFFIDQPNVTTDDTARSAAVLIAELVLNCPSIPEQQVSLAEQTLKEADPLPFALLVFQEIDRGLSIFQRDKHATPDDWLGLPSSSLAQLRQAVVERITRSADEAPPYAKFGPKDALRLLQFWSTEGRNYLNARLRKHPEEAQTVLSLFPDVTITFDFIADLADPDMIAAALKKHSGETRLESVTRPDETKPAREFLAEIDRRKAKNTAKPEVGE